MANDQKVNLEPRVSLNKLGEFLTAAPSRRRKILKDQKYPSSFIVARYNDAESAISDYLSSNPFDISVLDTALSKIENKVIETDWDSQTKSLNYDAIDSFYDICDQFSFQACSLNRVAKNVITPMYFGNVSISVRPEILITKKVKDNTQIGAIKLYFSKTYNLNKESGEYIASVLMEYLKTNQKTHTPTNKLCCVVDVFGQQVYTAPASYKRRMENVIAATQEISAIWPML